MKQQLISFGILWGAFIFSVFRQLNRRGYFSTNKKVETDIERAEKYQIKQDKGNLQQQQPQTEIQAYMKNLIKQKKKTKKIQKVNRRQARNMYKDWFIMNKKLTEYKLIDKIGAGHSLIDDAYMEKTLQIQDYQFDSYNQEKQQVKQAQIEAYDAIQCQNSNLND